MQQIRPLVVFAGPTLAVRDLVGVCEAVCLPPAEQGAILDAAKRLAPRAIVLIDGAFGNVPAVRHKEILWALTKGIAVFGAASMGALRAAELDRYGMIGFGLIYRWYCMTPLLDDAAVAVAMGPPELGAPALSEALINVRLTLRRAERAAVISRSLRVALESVAASLYFAERTYPRVFEEAALRALAAPDTLEKVQAWVAANAVDQKRTDALALLSRIGAGLITFPRARTPNPLPKPLPLTEAWAIDLEASGLNFSSIQSTAQCMGDVNGRCDQHNSFPAAGLDCDTSRCLEVWPDD